MRSPWLIQTVWCSPGFQTPSKSGELLSTLDQRAAELAVVAALHLAAELLGHRHLAVADAEHRHAGLEDLLRRARAVALRHRARPAGEDHALRLQRARTPPTALWNGTISRIDARLAHAPRDELRHLAAEIDDEDGGVGGRRVRSCAAVRETPRRRNASAIGQRVPSGRVCRIAVAAKCCRRAHRRGFLQRG